jgi:hypothetical protein
VCPWLGLESGACVLVLEIISNCYCGRTGRRAGSDTIVIHHNGHGPCNGGEPARKTECTDCTPNFDTAQDWFNQLGYDSMEVFMPLHGCNRIRADQSCSAHCVSNAERGFDCSKCKPLGTTDSMVGSHQWFDQFEQMGDEAMRYFLEPVVLAVNCATIPRRSTAAGSLRCAHGSMVRVGAWLTVCFVLFCFGWAGGWCADAEALGYKHIVMAGLSGGGWTTTISAAIDPRITLSMPIAGSMPKVSQNG